MFGVIVDQQDVALAKRIEQGVSKCAHLRVVRGAVNWLKPKDVRWHHVPQVVKSVRGVHFQHALLHVGMGHNSVLALLPTSTRKACRAAPLFMIPDSVKKNHALSTAI